MTIRYNNTRWDIIQGQWHLIRFNRAFRYFLAAFGAFILWSSFTSSAIPDKSLTLRLIYSVVVLCGVFGVSIISGMLLSALSVILSKGKGMVGEHQLEITDEGLTERTDFNCSMNTWKGMKCLRKTGGFYLLFVTENTAHVIPRKRPLIEGDLEDFIKEFSQRINQANQLPN